MSNTDISAKTQTTSKKNNAKNLFASLSKLAPSIWWPLSWRKKLTPHNHPSQRLSAEQLEVRIWAFVVVSVTLILSFIVVALLYSVTFVTQPIKAMAPIDQAYTKMLNDIVLLIVGGIGGIMGKRAVSAAVQTIYPKEEPDDPGTPKVL
jgi:hypothetical protein